MQLDAFVTALSCLCASIEYQDFSNGLSVNSDQANQGLTQKLGSLSSCQRYNKTAFEAKIDELTTKVNRQEKELKSLIRMTTPQSLPQPTKAIPKNCKLENRVLGKLKFNAMLCDVESHGENWTMVAHRSHERNIEFNKDWEDWKYGFGQLDGEFYLGLEKIQAMTSDHRQEFLIIFNYPGNISRYANYDNLQIADESEEYTLKFAGKFEGDATEALKAGIGYKFSTPDRNNDRCPKDYKCPYIGGLAWYSLGRWFCCYQAGLSFHSKEQEGVPTDIYWYLRPKND